MPPNRRTRSSSHERVSVRALRRQRRRRVLLWLLLVAVAAAVVVGVAAIRVFQVGRDLRAIRDELVAAERQLKAGEPAAARQAVLRAQARATRATGVMHSRLELSLLDGVPVFHQNLASIRDAVGLALHLTTSGLQILDAAQPLQSADGKFEVPLRRGGVPLPVIARLQPQLRGLLTTLPTLSEAPRSRLLLPQIRSLNRQVYEQTELRRRQIGVLSEGLDLLAELSGANGPRRFLIAVANAAEMRGSGGMTLSYGQLTSAGGTFALDRFGGIDDLVLAEPVSVPAGAKDYLEHFASLAPTRYWRNTNLAADFSVVGPLYEAMYLKASGKGADGVLQVDSMGLAAFLTGTGPVDVPGLGAVSAENVVRVTLNEAYARFPSRRDRQEVLGDVAEAVFRKLVTGDYPSLRPLATALVDAASRRQIILHLTPPDGQRHAVALGAEGSLPPRATDFTLLTVQNFSANKLDYYLDTALDISGSRVAGTIGRVKATITVTNALPRGQTTPAYVVGPNTPDQEAGKYVGLVTLYAPTGAALAPGAAQSVPGASVHTENGNTAVSFPVTLAAGESRRIVLDLTLPPAAADGYQFVLPASSRVRPTVVKIDLDRGGGRRVQFSGPLGPSVAIFEPRR